ncbi:MAG: hypothetical protein KIG65_01100 [Eubacteriales bacterium]|nr:hypothetical protein [Eubacteriales bacterium]
MFLNPYQKYIDELINEYGPLQMRQLLVMVNSKFKSRFPNLDKYIAQMERYYDYERIGKGEEAIVAVRGMQPDYDIIRSFEVMLYFNNQVICHRRSRELVTIRFYVDDENHTREISVIPVKAGSEKMVSEYVNDRFAKSKSEVVMYLLENKNQIKKITSKRYQRFAVIGKQGVVFYKDK